MGFAKRRKNMGQHYTGQGNSWPVMILYMILYVICHAAHCSLGTHRKVSFQPLMRLGYPLSLLDVSFPVSACVVPLQLLVACIAQCLQALTCILQKTRRQLSGIGKLWPMDQTMAYGPVLLSVWVLD